MITIELLAAYQQCWRRQGNTADTLPGARRPGVWDDCHFSMITILWRLVVAFSMNTIVIWGSWVPLKEMLFASTSLSRVWGARRLCVFHDDDREYNCDHEKGTQVTLERDVVCLNISFKGLRCLGDKGKQVTLERDVVCLKHQQTQFRGLSKLVEVRWVLSESESGFWLKEKVKVDSHWKRKSKLCWFRRV